MAIIRSLLSDFIQKAEEVFLKAKKGQDISLLVIKNNIFTILDNKAKNKIQYKNQFCSI